MSGYAARVTAPINTPASSPVTATIQVAERIVTHVAIRLPLNAAGLVGVQLLDGDSRFYPALGSQTEWITGDNVTPEWDDPEGYELRSRPGTIKVRIYNLDDTFPRTVDVRATVVNVTLAQLLREMIAALVAARKKGA